MSIANGMTDVVDIFQFSLTDDGFGGQERGGITSVTSNQLARITIDKATAEIGSTRLHIHGEDGREWWKVVMFPQARMYSEGDYFLKLNFASPPSVILKNMVYKIVRHRTQRDFGNSYHHDSLFIELDESATSAYRTINGITPTTAPFGQ